MFLLHQRPKFWFCGPGFRHHLIRRVNARGHPCRKTKHTPPESSHGPSLSRHAEPNFGGSGGSRTRTCAMPLRRDPVSLRPHNAGVLLLNYGGVASFRMSALRRELHPRFQLIFLVQARRIELRPSPLQGDVQPLTPSLRIFGCPPATRTQIPRFRVSCPTNWTKGQYEAWLPE